jgi:hypothetical protein
MVVDIGLHLNKMLMFPQELSTEHITRLILQNLSLSKHLISSEECVFLDDLFDMKG